MVQSIITGSTSQQYHPQDLRRKQPDMGVMYATREDVKSAPGFSGTRSDAQIDRAIEAASRSVEGLLHRRFYPEIDTRYFDWPQPKGNRSYRIWLDDNELVSLTSASFGGVSQTVGNLNLEPANDGPPYEYVETNRSTATAFSAGSTNQRAIALTGVFCGCAIDESTAGTAAEAVDSSEQLVDVSDSSVIGVGSLIRVDDERMLVTGKQSLSSGQTLQADMTAVKNNQTVSVTTGTSFAVGERLLVDSEYMLIVDIAGNNLIVERGVDGSTLAAHTTGATIYVPRTLVVTRGALGTTAAAHNASSTIYLFNYPGPVRELVVAETLRILQGRASTYATGDSQGDNQPTRPGDDLTALRMAAIATCGRSARHKAV